MTENKDTAHSPLPWVRESSFEIRLRDASTLRGADGSLIAAFPDVSEAEFTRKCVNSHDALVDALKKILEAVRPESDGRMRDYNVAIESLYIADALAKVALKQAGAL